jgi:hypothetical protein
MSGSVQAMLVESLVMSVFTCYFTIQSYLCKIVRVCVSSERPARHLFLREMLCDTK